MTTPLDRYMDELEVAIAAVYEGQRRRKDDEVRRALERCAVIVEKAKTAMIDPSIHAYADEKYAQRRMK